MRVFMKFMPCDEEVYWSDEPPVYEPTEEISIPESVEDKDDYN